MEKPSTTTAEEPLTMTPEEEDAMIIGGERLPPGPVTPEEFARLQEILKRPPSEPTAYAKAALARYRQNVRQGK